MKNTAKLALKYMISKLILLLIACVLIVICDILGTSENTTIVILNGIIAIITLGLFGHLFIMEPCRKLYKLYKWSVSK